nr:immunoglobulin heavy chain junction region [Mus musculus]
CARKRDVGFAYW